MQRSRPFSGDSGQSPARTCDATLRVCLVSEIFHPEDRGGQGQQAFELSRRLRQRGVGVEVATRRNRRDSSSHETIEGIRITRLPPSGLLKGTGWAALLPGSWFLLRLFVYLLGNRGRYDVVLVQGVKAILLPTMAASYMLGKRCIVKVDALAELEQDFTPESLDRMGLKRDSAVVRWWAGLREWLLRCSDAVVAISTQLVDSLTVRGLHSSRVAHIPNGIDLTRWVPPSLDKRELRRRLQLPEGPLLIYTGRLSRAKGLMLLMDVYERLAARFPQAHLVLVGSGERSFDNCEAELRERARSAVLERRITLTGHVENVVDYVQACDVFVLCSESEGFGLSLVEAMAAGLPCVSTAVGVAPELVRTRDNGWLIPVRDEHALYSALAAALEDPSQWPRMGAAARQAVTDRFDLDAVVARYVQLAQSLLSQAPAVRCVES